MIGKGLFNEARAMLAPVPDFRVCHPSAKVETEKILFRRQIHHVDMILLVSKACRKPGTIVIDILE